MVFFVRLCCFDWILINFFFGLSQNSHSCRHSHIHHTPHIIHRMVERHAKMFRMRRNYKKKWKLCDYLAKKSQSLILCFVYDVVQYCRYFTGRILCFATHVLPSCFGIYISEKMVYFARDLSQTTPTEMDLPMDKIQERERKNFQETKNRNFFSMQFLATVFLLFSANFFLLFRWLCCFSQFFGPLIVLFKINIYPILTRSTRLEKHH